MDFPVSLPSPTRAGYGIAPVPRVRRTAFELGNLRARRQSAAAPWRVDVRWRFTTAQQAVFDAWFTNDIAHGADEFYIDLANGLGMGTVTARFAAAPAITLRGPQTWDVSATLRVGELPVMAADYLEAASTYNPNDIVAGAPLLHTLIHTTLPASYW